MEIRSFVIAILIVAVTILQSGEAKKCYACDSRISNTCASGPSSSEIGECVNSKDDCGICSYTLANGTSVIVRSCGTLTIEQAEKATSLSCTMCEGDLCNTANAATISMTVLGCLVSFWAIRFVLKDSY